MRKVLFLALLLFPIYFFAEDGTLPSKKLSEAEKLLPDIKTRQKALGILANLAKKNKDSNEKFEAKALLSKVLREEKKFDKAIETVSDCTDFDKIGKQSLFQFKSTYLMAFLEAAHCKAVDKDKPAVREAFKMLDYAENSTDGIDKARSQYKYGSVLFDINEFGKAETYLKKAIETADTYLKGRNEKDSAGENKPIAGMEDWQKLKPQIDELLFRVSIELLREEYGAGYALYVKMRSYYDKGEFYEAFPVAEKLMKDFPDELYGEAGRFHWCKMLIGNDFAGDMKDKTLPDGMKELHKFIKDKPYGLYRGEAWMELGRVELEKNWDSDKSSEYYTKALEWFRTMRERKDAADLYAVQEKVVQISAPQKPISSLDEWFRTIYREPSPKEIVNIKTAPWYVDEMEKECLFMVGFFLLMENQPDKAKECFLQVKSISKDIAMLDSKGIPNALWRLESACNVGYMVFPPDEKKYLKGKNKLICSYAELNYLLEKFDVAKSFYAMINDNPKSSAEEKAMVIIGMTDCSKRSDKIVPMLEEASKLAKKSALSGTAIIRLAGYYGGDAASSGKSAEYFEKYLRYFPEGQYANMALFRLGLEELKSDSLVKSEKILSKLQEKYPDSGYTACLNNLIKEKK